MDDVGQFEWDGWLHPNHQSASLEEIQQFAPALDWFDWACQWLIDQPYRFVIVDGVLRTSTPYAIDPARGVPRRYQAKWDAQAQVWVRLTVGVSSKPRQPPRLFEHEEAGLPKSWEMHVYGTGLVRIPRCK